jgi:hypothetical protein
MNSNAPAPTETTQVTPQWTDKARQNLQTLLQACPGKNTVLYGLIDSAVDESLYEQLMNEPSCSNVTCLFDGDPAIRYRNVAPYLMVLNFESPLTLAWLDHAWAKHWGVWMATANTPARLKAHLKKFLFVKKPGCTKAYFRYYDPRVMHQIMPIMNLEQRGRFFGLNAKPMPDAFFAVAQKPDQTPVLQRYQPTQSRLMRFANASNLEADALPWQ